MVTVNIKSYMKKTVAVLMTVFNRKQITIQGLKSLFKAISLTKDLVFDVYLVDDNSPDGTIEAVKKQFDSIITIPGTGGLYWGGGMNLAWNTAVKRKKYDYFLWYNDDNFLFDDSLLSLFKDNEKYGDDCIISGVFHDKLGNVSYGGKKRDGSLIDVGSNINVFYMNGNLVLIPYRIFQKVGFIDSRFVHGIGDYDYGFRAINNNFLIKLTSKVVGISDRHDQDIPYLDKRKTLFMRMKILYSPKFNPINTFYYNKKYFGIRYAIKKFIRKNISAMIPSIVNYRDIINNDILLPR